MDNLEGSPRFSVDGDQLFAYQGTTDNPSFIYGLNVEGAGVWQTPPEFSQAIEALEAAAEDLVISGPRGDGVDPVLEPANAAFEAFPDRIREKMNDADMLLVVPDFQWNADVIPYELLHDGDSYLMR